MKISDYFARKVRDNGEEFYSFSDLETPDWLKDAVYDASCGSNSDWIWETVHSIVVDYDNGNLTSDSDSIAEWADSYVDVYTKDRANWYADHCLTHLYDNAVGSAKDIGFSIDGSNPVDDALGAIQFFAIEGIVQTMLQAIEDNLDSDDDSDED